MRIDIITVLPEMIEGFFNCSIMKRAQDKGLAEIHIHNLRDIPKISIAGWMTIHLEVLPVW